MTRPIDPKSLSHAMSHALRHEPESYGLHLDPEGWVALDALIAALQAKRSAWRTLARSDITRMMAAADKQRYELDGDRIRALYGHSTPTRISRDPAVPPGVLYHGTAPDLVAVILAEGLRPMSRQQVHLSADQDTARQVGTRKDANPALLVVDTVGAGAAGVLFYHGGGPVWLAGAVPGRFIQPLDAMAG